MENISVSHFDSDAIQDKKLEDYKWEKYDFLAGQELTVTITLGEYRELVSSKATAKQEIDTKIQKVAALEQDLKRLKEEVERLKAENYDLQNKILAARKPAQDDVANEEGECEEYAN